MIKPSQFTQQMIDLQKTSFLSLYKAATSVQKQASSAMDLMLNQLPWIPSEGRQVISDWLGTCQQEGDRFKTYVEKSFTSLGLYFSPEAVAKTAKPLAEKAKKASPTEPKKAVAEPAKKAVAEPAKKAVAEPAKKAAPAMTKKTEPVETEPAKTSTAKKVDVPKKESKTALK